MNRRGLFKFFGAGAASAAASKIVPAAPAEPPKVAACPCCKTPIDPHVYPDCCKHDHLCVVNLKRSAKRIEEFTPSNGGAYWRASRP